MILLPAPITHYAVLPKHQQEARHCASGTCRTLIGASRNSKVSQQRAASFPRQTPEPPAGLKAKTAQKSHPGAAAGNQQATDWRARRRRVPCSVVGSGPAKACSSGTVIARRAQDGPPGSHSGTLAAFVGCAVRLGTPRPSLGLLRVVDHQRHAKRAKSEGPTMLTRALVLTDGAIYRIPARTRIEQRTPRQFQAANNGKSTVGSAAPPVSTGTSRCQSPPRLPLQFSLLSYHLHPVQCHLAGPLPL